MVEPREVDWKGEVQDRELVLRIFRDWDEGKYEHLVSRLTSDGMILILA
jgi:hypothetical protein